MYITRLHSHRQNVRYQPGIIQPIYFSSLLEASEVADSVRVQLFLFPALVLHFPTLELF